MNELIAGRRALLESALRERYTYEHVRGLAESATKRGAKRTRRKIAVGVGATVALVALVVSRSWEPRVVSPLEQSMARAPVHVVATPTPMYSVVPLGVQAPQWSEAPPEDTALPRIRLDAGDVRVEVPERLRVDLSPPPGANFREATVEGDHAVFDLRWQHAAVVVASERGEVTVYVDGSVHRLEPGDRLVVGASTRSQLASSTRARETSRRADGRRPDWKKLARAGDLEGARTALRDVRVHDPEDLMFAADTLRRAGHPGEAEVYLRRVVESHPNHVVAPVAAFTLGKLYLQRMNRPADAARMFARVRSAPGGGGALREDALAREVESWAEAGRIATARSLAQAYVEQHPQGRHVPAMRRYLD